MATVYDLLNPDSTEVEEQRVIRAPGATTGDVLTVAANGTVSPAPGGGSQPITRGEYTGNNVSVPNTGASTPLTWNTLLNGTALLDLTDPAEPVVITAGVYAVTVTTTPGSGMTDGKVLVARLIVNGDQADAIDVKQTVAVADVADFDPAVTMSATYYCEAGSILQMRVAHADAGAINFALSAWVQRLA